MSYIDPDQLHGALDGFITFIGDNAANLTAKGLNPTTVEATATVIRDDLAGKKDVRDKKKTELTIAQQGFVTAGVNNYSGFSDLVDTVAGALGKKTPAGEQALNYRKHLNATPNHTGSQPAPAATPAH
jgi:hypothetical protein